MVWGLEKLWPSGSPSTSTSPTSSGTQPQPSISSTSTAPLVTATLTTDPSTLSSPQSSQSKAKPTLSPAVLARIQQESASSELDPSLWSSRSGKQFTLFAAGAAFLLLSSRMTRRQLAKRALTPPPTFKQNNLGSDISVNGPMEAFEALSIATINVLSFSMMMTGGLLWAFDISSVNDLRRKIRGGLGVDGTGRDTKAVEEEFEEWIAGVLERKMGKEQARKGGIGEREEVREHWRNERGQEREFK